MSKQSTEQIVADLQVINDRIRESAVGDVVMVIPVSVAEALNLPIDWNTADPDNYDAGWF